MIFLFLKDAVCLWLVCAMSWYSLTRIESNWKIYDFEYVAFISFPRFRNLFLEFSGPFSLHSCNLKLCRRYCHINPTNFCHFIFFLVPLSNFKCCVFELRVLLFNYFYCWSSPWKCSVRLLFFFSPILCFWFLSLCSYFACILFPWLY